jgi:predicted N-acetyltransferase YhbS
MRYICSGLAEEDFISDILAIDASVFDPAFQGTDSSLRSRYNINKESYILAFDDSKIVGYVAFFPITKDLSERMKTENKPYDDDIQPEDILPSYGYYNDDFDMFLISLAVLPGHHGRGIGAELMKRSFDFISGKIKEGCKIKNAYAYAYTGAGERLLLKGGYTELKNIIHPEKKTAVKLMSYCFDDK